MKATDRDAGGRNGLAEELERQKLYFESLLEISPVAIVTTDLDTKVTTWNPEAERLFGYTRNEAVGRRVDDLIAASDELRAEAAASVSQTSQAGRFHTVTRRMRKDRTLVDVDLLAVTVVVDDEPVGYYALYQDIGELQRQKQHYESLFELSPTAIVSTDPEANVTSWNPAAEQLFGYTAAEAIGRNIDDLIATDPRVHSEAVGISARNVAGEKVRVVTQRTRKDGSLVDVQVLAAPIVIADEQVGSYALYHDISELQRQKQYYEALVEVSPSAIATVDMDATVTSWNEAAERLFGYTAAEAIGQNIDELVTQDERLRAEALGVSRRGAIGEESHLLTQRQRKDGAYVDVQVLAAPIVVGDEQVGFYALYHDISELQRQKRYYESLVESSPSAIVTLDMDATVTSWNPAAERLFGYTRDEAIGQNLEELVAKQDDIRQEAESMNREGATAGHSHRVTRRTRKDGSLVDVDVVGARIDVGDEQVGLYAIYSDISELQRQRREAEAATEAKSAFLATMSHEIRTPMNAVIGMTELLLGTRLEPEQRSFAEVIRTSGEALLSVINDILDFSKIEAGRLDLDRHPFDLRECVESAMELLGPIAADKALDLAYLLAPEAPEALVGDAARLRQILLNLLNNAVKFTESGEVVLRVDAEPLEQPGRPSSRYRVHFAVSDTGIGISTEQLETLFESFSQVDTSTTRRYGGTGLGLAISKRLAEAMGGSIWVDSREGEGSTFHFTIEADAAARPTRAYERDTVALDGKRVLIVDDNATNRHIARAYAEAWGMVARDSDSPGEAIEWVRRGDPFDVAILDMQMPELDGLALAREVRRYRDADRLPLILLTSLGRREDASDDVFAAHLTKPIRPSQLYNALLDVLGATVPPPRVEEDAPAHEKPAGLDILIAEDNAVNQRLALLMLEKLGYRADVVSNGAEALEALERRRYDVVLMDVQMPELDGLEATRRIHERWAADRPHIIAVTAGAMSEERERCLAAGMDEYLSKPIRIEELSAALGALRPDSRAQLPAGALDEAALEQLRSTLGDSATVEIVETFLAEGPRLFSALYVAVEQGDAHGLRRAAHTLKSNAATFGAAALAELCQELETIGEEGTMAGASELLARADAEHERLRSDLEVQVT